MDWLILDATGHVLALVSNERDADKVAYALEAASFEPASEGSFKLGDQVPVWHE